MFQDRHEHEIRHEHEGMKHEDEDVTDMNEEEERRERWVDSKFEKGQSQIPTHVRTVSVQSPDTVYL